MSNKSIGNEPVYDARTLGAPRMFVLGLQHMFAMFGATVLVPALTGLDVATTLLFAGLGTLLFHLLTKGKVPAFLGSSFAFIGGYNAVRTIGTNPDGSAIYNNDLLALRLLRRRHRGPDVHHPVVPVQDLRRQESHALLPADRHRPDHHRHRPDAVLFRHHQLPCQLAHRHRRDPDRHRLQHVGQGHGQDHPDPARRARFLHLCHHHRPRRARLRRRRRQQRQVVRPADLLEKQRVPPLRRPGSTAASSGPPC